MRLSRRGLLAGLVAVPLAGTRFAEQLRLVRERAVIREHIDNACERLIAAVDKLITALVEKTEGR